jgi:4-amino-4-deoxy-L-arabinose transferase-like glycosyltransferase
MGRNIFNYGRKHPIAALLLICAVAWLPGFLTLPPLDRDESRFAQATKQMLETGDFIDINFGAGPRYEKPVGIYWLQAASTAVFGGGTRDAIWTYRLPSFLGALAAVAATFWLVRAFAPVEAAFFAGLILGLSALMMSEANIAKTDAVLLACIAATQAVLIRTYLNARSPATYRPPAAAIVLFGWVAFGMGVLVKGPIIALVVLAGIGAVIVADRDWRWLKGLHPLPGMAVALAIVLPWAIAIGLASHGLFYEKSLGMDFAMKIAGGEETHGAPPGYYTLLASLTFWPGTLLLIPGIVYGIARRKDPAVRYLLAWAAASWLMFELAPTKLPHYVLPVYPALAALSALWLSSGKSILSGAQRIAQNLSLLLFVAVGLALAAFLVLAPGRFGSGAPWWLYAAAALGGIAVLAVIPQMTARRFPAAMATAALSALLLYATAGFITVPRLTQLWLSPRLAEAVARHAERRDPPVVTAGYAEPSIAFLLGTHTALDDGREAGRTTARAGGLALVSDDSRGGFLAAVAQEGARAEALEEIAGLNYSRGHKTRITLYRVAPRAN